MARPAAHRTAAEQEWIDRNPLRRWRTERKFSLLDAAAATGISTVSLRLFETSVRTIRRSNADRLRERVSPTVIDDLAAWAAEAPVKEQLPA
jgi:Na+-translocating ferredoxin:NAD+ oxidoreductase RnfC subunit